MDNICIIHFSPPEMYPPLQNFVRVLENLFPKQKITLLTTAGKFPELSRFETRHPLISINRLGYSGPGIAKVARLWYYFVFYVGCVWHLFWKRPGRVMYYETISSFPAYLYKRFINRQADIIVHYHEYTSTGEYENGMYLSKLFHKHERWLYPRVQWLSQTNTYRMQLFLEDMQPLTVSPVRIIPNYPPASWYRRQKKQLAIPMRTVYIGALSLDTMYTREMAEWILAQNGDVIWDIYSYNITEDAKAYLIDIDSPWIQLKGGLDYAALPDVLNQYDIGVILYKGHIPNYVYNAPNKLFEYSSAGLQVWVPDVMKGAMEYVDGMTILSVDFGSMHLFQYRSALQEEKLNQAGKHYFCEEALKPLADALLKARNEK